MSACVCVDGLTPISWQHSSFLVQSGNILSVLYIPNIRYINGPVFGLCGESVR